MAFLLILILALAVNFSGINVRFFTDDPGLYASIAKNMVLKNNYLELFTYGKDWLDKPHFPFWMAALSFKIFGFSTWSYKLPALLFFVMAVCYTFLFALRNYGIKAAWLAVLILTTAQHLLMSNTDVRAEPYLMALIIASVYHFFKLDKHFSWTDLLLGALFAGCAVMTKGIFALIPIGAAVLGEMIFKDRIKTLFRWKWLLAIIFTIIFILPEIYSLYVQFDSQPGKTTFQNTQISGIHWFLWDSQFGRFINNGPITRTSGSKIFYIHTLIWAFAPWFFMLIYAVFINLKSIFQQKRLKEYGALCGGLSMWIIFSLSSFQLPFYTNIIFPFFAIMIAAVFSDFVPVKTLRAIGFLQYLQCGLLLLAVLLFNYFLRPQQSFLFVVEIVIFALIIFWLGRSTAAFNRIFLFSCCATLFVNLYLNTIFYPLLSSFKADAQAPKLINQFYPKQPIFVIRSLSNPFQFYCNEPVQLLPINDVKNSRYNNQLVYTDESTLKELQHKRSIQILQTVINYPNEIVYKQFVWYKTRSLALDRYYVVRLK